MFKIYTADKVKKIVARIEEEYEKALASQIFHLPLQANSASVIPQNH